MNSRNLILLMFLCLLAAPSLGKDGWTVVMKGNPGPQVRVADKSVERESEDSVNFVLGVGSGSQEGHVRYNLTRAKMMKVLEYGQWVDGRWIPGQKIDEPPYDLRPHMTPLYEFLFPFE